MNVIAIMELIGVVAGIAAVAFFLFGRQRRLSGLHSVLFGLLLFAVLANSLTDSVEPTGIYKRLDFVEDYLDMLLVFIWGAFLFSLSAQSSKQQLRTDDGYRVYARELTVVFTILFVINIVYCSLFFAHSRDTLAKLKDYHGSALVSVVELRSHSNDAIQEGFAYVISGEAIEKEEFENWAQSFGAEAQALRAVGKLDEPDEREELATFEAIVALQKDLVYKARRMFVEYELRGAVSPETFHDYEGAIDSIGIHFAELQRLEQAAFDASQAKATSILEEVNIEMPLLGGFSIALMVSLFAILIWNFRHYSAHQELVRRELARSEERYRTLIESAPEAVFVLDVDEGRFIDVNENAVKVFRLEREQLLKSGPMDFSPEDQPDGRNSVKTAMELVQQALDGEMPRFEWLHLDSEGNEIHCEVRLARLPSSRRLVRASLTDISQRIKLEKVLAERAIEAELLFQSAAMADETDSLDAALQKCVDIVCEMTRWPVGHVYIPSSVNGAQQLEPTGIWHLADELRFTKFREVTERTPFVMGEGLPGRIWKSGEPAWIVNVQEDDNFPRNKLCEELGVKGAFGFPVTIREKTVAILEFFNEGQAEKNPTLLLLVRSVGEQVGRVIERKEAAENSRRRHDLVAEELEKAKGELILTTRFAAVGQMSAQIAHELRNPLGAVSNAVYYLKRHVPEGEGKWSEYLSLIKDEVATCNRFIDDLLDVTRGKAPNRETTSLPKLIDKALARHDIPKTVDVRVVCQPGPFEIFADRVQILQVVDNLLKNSLDAIGEKAGSIEIRTHRHGENDIITIQDTGTGISPEHRASVFDLLFTTKPAGTGLGLAICKQIIERHGGTIELIDESSPGTEFQVCLPHEEVCS